MIGQAPELPDAPRRPRPELGRDEVDRFGARAAHDLAHGEVGRGGIDRDMQRDPLAFGPRLDAVVDPAVLPDLLEPRHPHDGVCPGPLDDLGARGLHARAAPCEDAHIRVAGSELGDHHGGVIVAAGLERGEQDRWLGIGTAHAVR